MNEQTYKVEFFYGAFSKVYTGLNHDAVERLKYLVAEDRSGDARYIQFGNTRGSLKREYLQRPLALFVTPNGFGVEPLDDRRQVVLYYGTGERTITVTSFVWSDIHDWAQHDPEAYFTVKTATGEAILSRPLCFDVIDVTKEAEELK